ncbi:Potential DNA-binding domain [Cinara cedri]|uniref:KAT8 regulatory NSL complex subunit 2 n=1 Tax=Cinara cedri TaxID=506608 RepID=A0A5E4NH85_9HEMI|nr:Potential DNA-binding domain [Cinara cedri]
MERKMQINLKNEFNHYTPKYKSLNPFNEIDSKKLLEEKHIQNIDDSKPLDDEPPTNTVTVESDKQIPELEETDLIESDPLSNMPILSEKEAVRRVRDKYVKLQLLYAQEFKYLLFKYQKKRREFLINKKCDSGPSENGLLNNSRWATEEEYQKFQKLKQLEQYQKLPTGQEAVVFKTAMDRKFRATKLSGNKEKQRPLCSSVEMGIKCTEELIPYSNFCKKHILKDPNQVLFRACGILQNYNICQEPIVNSDIESTCVLHKNLPNHCH